jgi:hypothetical protein
MDTPVWFKSSYSSANGACVGCARTPAGGMAVRGSKHPATPPLTFSRTAWQLFTNTIKTPDIPKGSPRLSGPHWL